MGSWFEVRSGSFLEGLGFWLLVLDCFAIG